MVGSLTQWTWVWASSRCWWWTRKPGMLQSMELQSQRGLSNWTETETEFTYPFFFRFFSCIGYNRVLSFLCYGVGPSWYLFYICSCCSVSKSYLTLCDPMNCSTPCFPVLHCLPEFAQTHVHWVSFASQPSHPILSPSPPALSLSQHQGLFQWAGSSH